MIEALAALIFVWLVWLVMNLGDLGTLNLQRGNPVLCATLVGFLVVSYSEFLLL